MCTSYAGRVHAVDGHEADVAVRGAVRRISLAPLTLDGVVVRAGDCVLIHSGLAVARISEDDLQELEAMWEEAP